MGNRKRFWVTAFNIFLILSASPVSASRVGGSADAQNVTGLTDMPTQLEIDSHQCGELEQIFVTRTNELNNRVTTMQEDGPGARGQLGLVMKMRGMARIVRRAATLNCEWVTGTEHDTQILESIAARNLNGSPCRAAARDMLMAADEAPVENQAEMVMGSLQSLMSGNCEHTTEMTEEEEEDMPEVTTIDSPEMGAQIERETGQLEEEADEMIEDLAEQELNGDASLMQTAVVQAELLSVMVGVFATLLAFAVFCFVILPVITMIIGLALCLVVGFIGLLLFRPHAGGGCMRWFSSSARAAPMYCLIQMLLDAVLGGSRGRHGGFQVTGGGHRHHHHHHGHHGHHYK